ncbi:sulfate/molybdate ABC transporter ATP-binding protein [Mucilaginibacter celer]|uniref:ATP-binding cassette domain-containing protein n=1 Tax=Mucilaginibacter celer TaxID=2305508 RepID=A0A494VT80_9SPHI|nr:ATP-binding cassette domain-containing protein [Mucilaginibacter celer]AYL98154.1 ATP-binding cassette domain-containing protein [Mucilaginibacter celer]
MIRINIEKRMRAYKGEQVLRIDRTFVAGSITKIYGPSGSGKTTLLKLIAGLSNPDEGEIVVNGNPWYDSSRKINLSPQKRNTGFVFQNYAVFPNMTVLEHLKYAVKDAEWIKRLLHLGRLDTLSTHKPDHLSGGQQQRLAILRALAIKPKVLLMDEPFSALDSKMKMELIGELKPLLSELGVTTLIVSHNQQELEFFEGEVMDFEEIIDN